MQKIRSITEVGEGLRGTRVLLRTSLNVPVTASGEVGDLFRLKRALATIEYCAERGAKIILVGYIGRAGASLAPVAQALRALVPNIKITFTECAIGDAGEQVAALGEGECLMLENIRRESGEEKNDPKLAQALASLADIFVDDAFAEAHRPHASNVGVASLLPSYAGLLLLEEVERLSEALTPSEGSLAIIGGAKFETKEPLIAKLLTLYKKVLLGGALSDDVLQSRGIFVGRSLVSGQKVPDAIVHNDRIILPTDMMMLDTKTGGKRVADVRDIHANEDGLDIGTATAAAWSKEVLEAPFVLWNGPMGMYEKGFTNGTEALARALCEGSCRAVIGGGDTAAALAQFSFDPARVFISTGGGAMLEFLAEGVLPALEVLKGAQE